MESGKSWKRKNGQYSIKKGMENEEWYGTY